MKFSDVKQQLTAAFPVEALSWKPQVVTKDKKSGMAVAFVDPRNYEDRLNSVCPDDWHMEVTLSHQAQVIEYDSTWNNVTTRRQKLMGFVHATVRLTICGMTRTDVGESPADDPNAATSAVAQGFKRACSSFGLGRYLYSIPKTWKPIDEKGFFTQQSVAELRNMAKQYGEQAALSPVAADLEPHPDQDLATGGGTPDHGQPAAPPPPAAPSAPAGQAAPPPAAPAGGFQRPDHLKLTPEQVEGMMRVKREHNINDNTELNFYIKRWMPDYDQYMVGLARMDQTVDPTLSGAYNPTEVWRGITRENATSFIAYMDKEKAARGNASDF